MDTSSILPLNELKKLSSDRWYITEQCKGKKTLEIGCVNHGIEGINIQRKIHTWLFDYLHNYAEQATGIDIDKNAVDYLAEQGYDVRFGDAQNFNLDEQFDLIIASKLIDHLLNIDGFLQSCKKHLAPGGKLIIGDDNILCLPQLLIWNLKKCLGKPDEDITIKVVPEYFKLFAKRYDLKVSYIHYTVGTGKSKLLNFFRFIDKITPKFLIYPPLFYPYFMIELTHDK